MALNRMKATRRTQPFNYRVILIQVNNELYNKVKEERLKKNITLRKFVTRAILNYLRSLDTSI